ncbi:MAG: hypothetical protein KDD61_00250 [Bdellovibrionales bacterium]|nr:hypothetical protein [Bdellovibrionales bacterium]
MNQQPLVKKIIFFFLVATFIGTYSTAKEATKTKRKALPMDPSQTLKIVYGSAPWNNDSTKIDTAYLYVRDGSTGKMVKILLEETEPDSSTFQGFFSLGWAQMEEVYREVYVPPVNLRKGNQAAAVFAKMILKNKVPRRPIVFKKTKQGMQVLDVYDTREQAEAAFHLYQKQQAEESQREQENTSLAKPIPSKSNIELAQELEKKKAIAKALAEAAKAEMDRVRMEQLERQKREQKLAEMKALKEKEIQARKAEAKRLSEQAIQAFKESKFQLAEDLFRKSVDLDPENRGYYYYFGVALYKNEKYEDSLVKFKLSTPPAEDELNQKYYMGLVHYKLKELSSSLERFAEVRKAGHPVLSPSAAFYQGLIHFSLEKYQEAKEPFEWVIDNSNDPALDDKAENYLEKIAALIAFKKRQSERFIFSAMGGVQYDSNVLFSPDGQDASQGTTTDLGGFRGMGTGSFVYRPVYTRTSEFSINTSAVGMYSFNSAFSKADPYLGTLTLPYAWKGTWGKKGYKLTLTPGYEMLYMDANDDGTAESLLNSILFNTDVTIVMDSDWFASYQLLVRSDDSLSADSTGDADADALKYTLKTKHTFLMDKAKKQAFIVGGGITVNAANGKDKKYQRYDVSFLFAKPFEKWKDASWNAGLSAYQLTYPDATTTRNDTNVTLTGGVSQPFTEAWSWGVTGSYSTNQSDNAANTYSKYTLLGSVSYKFAK